MASHGNHRVGHDSLEVQGLVEPVLLVLPPCSLNDNRSSLFLLGLKDNPPLFLLLLKLSPRSHRSEGPLDDDCSVVAATDCLAQLELSLSELPPSLALFDNARVAIQLLLSCLIDPSLSFCLAELLPPPLLLQKYLSHLHGSL